VGSIDPLAGFCFGERESAEREGRPEFWYWERSMELKYVLRADTKVGTSVRVQEDYRKPHRQGMVGTIKKRYGTDEYTVFEVQFSDGQTELFWEHQLEEATESFPRKKKRRWVFW
jgi:hypothetical protein